MMYAPKLEKGPVLGKERVIRLGRQHFIKPQAPQGNPVDVHSFEHYGAKLPLSGVNLSLEMEQNREATILPGLALPDFGLGFGLIKST